VQSKSVLSQQFGLVQYCAATTVKSESVRAQAFKTIA
jgi:hypothetical protein